MKEPYLVWIYLLFFWESFGHSNGKENRRRIQKSVDFSGHEQVVLTEAYYWCYYCASPRSNEKREMLAAMDQLLEIRGSQYPYEAINEHCHNPVSESQLLIRQSCKYPFCHKITFNDGEGSPLTIRGCSEKFIASNQKVYCRNLHSQLDIRECSCKANGTCGVGKNGASIGIHKAGLSSAFLMIVAVMYNWRFHC